VVYSDQKFIGGGELWLRNLLGALDQRIDVTVAGTTPAIVEKIAAGRPGVRIRHIRPVKNKWDVAGIVAHLRAIRDLRPDLLQTNGNPWSCQYALSAGLVTPGVMTLAVYHAVHSPVRRSQLWLNRLNMKRLDARVAVSREAAEHVELMVGLPDGSVQVIHNGVPEARVEPVHRPVNGPIAGSVGRLSFEKGYDVLLRALPALPGVTGVLLSDGPDRERLAQLADELGVATRVIMPGWVPDSRQWLPTFDVFVQPSRLDSFPLSIIEAMLASRPVVATDVGGVSELVADGETGLLVPPDDPEALAEALGSLLGDPARRERMGEAGRSRAQEAFGFDQMVRSYESLYEELLDSRD
jgi:glycosyltransferase involved in cell wall biosynthesis